MKTQPITRDHRVQRRVRIQRETIITRVLTDDYKRRKYDENRLLDSRRAAGTE